MSKYGDGFLSMVRTGTHALLAEFKSELQCDLVETIQKNPEKIRKNPKKSEKIQVNRFHMKHINEVLL